MKVFVFGNELVAKDSLPVKLLPDLKKKFPSIQFIRVDPAENWADDEKEIIILDTVEGLKKVTIFNSLDEFQKPPNVSLHDYDVYTDLTLPIKFGIV